MRISVIFVILFFLNQSLGFTQSLNLFFSDSNKNHKFKIQPKSCNDSIAIQKALSECIVRFYSKGYLASTIDSFHCNPSSITAYGKRGDKYRWIIIYPDSITNTAITNISISLPNVNGKTLSPKTFSRFFNSLLTQLEDNGYPFAKVTLHNVDIKPNGISSGISIETGNRITIDTIYLKGDVKLNQKKLAAIVNLKRGEVYSELKIRKIDKRLRQQHYLSVIKSTEVEFLYKKARIYCYLGNKPASRFWGMAGFYKDKLDDKLKLNGDINLTLANALHNGEKLDFSWIAPGQGTQNLNIKVDIPYIFGWQVGLVGSFLLYKRDSTYITLNPKLSIAFFTNNRSRFLINADYKKTSFNSKSISTQGQFENSESFLYGLGYEYNSFEADLLPIRGMLVKSSLNTGKRHLTQKQTGTTYLLEGEFFFESYIPVYLDRLIFAARLNSKVKTLYHSKESSSLFENEMYRVGGMGTIRGFNQEMIFSQAYSATSLELHLRLNEGSGIYLFTDKAFVKVYEFGNKKDAWPLGMGIGINLATKAGFFNLSYALGQGFGQSLSSRDAKVHFGILMSF